MKNKISKISGKIVKVFFRNVGFSTGLLLTKGRKFEKFAGKICADVGRRVTLCGTYKIGKFGKQFQVDYVDPKLSMDLEGLTKYLAIRPDVKGIGLSRAEKIVSEHGKDFEKFLFSASKNVNLFGESTETAFKDLAADWESSCGWNEVYAWLASFDLSYTQIKALVSVFGSEIAFFLKKDPYELIEQVKGLGFVRMDEVAMKLGFDKKFKGRLHGSVKHVAGLQLKQGHCWSEYNEIAKVATQLLALDDLDAADIVDKAIEECILDRSLSYESLGSEGVAVGLSKIANKEKMLADVFSNQGNNPHFSSFKDPEKIIESACKEYTLNERQKRSLLSALESNVSVISGGAGTGKTHTLRAIADVFSRNDLSVKMAAPTGKAARRIEELTERKASTLHKLLGYNGVTYLHQKTKEKFSVDADVLIVDEVSMVDVELFWHLFQSVDLTKTSLVLVGDHNQLPPVGAGNVLRDLMLAQPIAITVLTEVIRQAGILKLNSMKVLDGSVEKSHTEEKQAWYVEDYYAEPYQVRDRLLEMFDRSFEDLGFHITQDVQILSPTHRGVLGATQLNFDIQRIVQEKMYGIKLNPINLAELPEEPNFVFLKHDKVIQTVNDYKKDVMNGEIGFVSEVHVNGDIEVLFSGQKVSLLIKKDTKAMRDLQLAYCLSIHKVQGSQFPCVATIIHKTHSFMHHRNLLYTAVTRASKSAIIIGDKWGVQNCANKEETTRRRTFLSFYMPPKQKNLSSYGKGGF